MNLLALDLARSTGWALGPATNSSPRLVGSFRLETPGDLIGPLTLELKARLEGLLPAADLVAYERPLVRFAHASQVLNGLAWIVEHVCAERELLCLPVPNTQAKKHFCGKTYSKKVKPYPGLVRARELGFELDNTDEADAMAIFSYVAHRYQRGDIEAA
jgi:hypothetical protein